MRVCDRGRHDPRVVALDDLGVRVGDRMLEVRVVGGNRLPVRKLARAFGEALNVGPAPGAPVSEWQPEQPSLWYSALPRVRSAGVTVTGPGLLDFGVVPAAAVDVEAVVVLGVVAGAAAAEVWWCSPRW